MKKSTNWRQDLTRAEREHIINNVAPMVAPLSIVFERLLPSSKSCKICQRIISKLKKRPSIKKLYEF